MTQLLRFPKLASLPRVVHGFAHAQSLGAFDARRADDLQRLAQAVAPSAKLVRTYQTHSATVRWIAKDDASFSQEEIAAGVDGLATADTDLALVALGADCPMLFLVAPMVPAIGLAHCGWRGVAGGIVDRAVDLLFDRTRAPIQSWRAVIAPGARGCCYEVGSEVLDQLAAAEMRVDRMTQPYKRRDGGTSRAIDLARGIALRLEERGMNPIEIEVAEDCTICGGEHYHSHRRSGALAGRMAGALALRT